MSPLRSEDVLAALPHLPASELAKVRDQALILLALAPERQGQQSTAEPDVPGSVAPQGGDVAGFHAVLYAAIAAELQRRTQARCGPFAVFSKSGTYYKHFLPGANVAFSANRQWFPKQSKAQTASMVRLYALLCMESLKRQERPLAWYNINAALSNLPSVVDAAFPGYAEAGLLGKVQLMRTTSK